MNAIEIRGLTKKFGPVQALSGLDMTVPQGAIYGFIGENGSGKSTTEKLICGLLVPDGGTIRLFGREYTDADVRAKTGVLIETPGCFPDCSVWNNLMLQAANLHLKNPREEVRRILKTVRMEGSAGQKFKNCSLGMKQRIGIALALLGDPKLLILDEPINGLDVDGMRILRDVLTDITKHDQCTVVISSHILGELEKIATHYGIVRGGKMIREMTAEELNADCRTYIAVKAENTEEAKAALGREFTRIETDGNGYIRIYDRAMPDGIVRYLYDKEIIVTEIRKEKISLEEYYTDWMKEEKSRGTAV